MRFPQVAEPAGTEKSLAINKTAATESAPDGHSSTPDAAALSWLTQCHRNLVNTRPLTPSPRRNSDGVSWSTAHELGSVMLEYALRTTDRHALDEAIAQLRIARDDGPADGVDRVANSYRLSTALYTRFDRFGDQKDLVATIAELQDAGSTIDVDDNWDPTHHVTHCLHLLARTLQCRAVPTGALNDLVAADDARRTGRLDRTDESGTAEQP
jgi:hypothetical protein